MFARIAICSLFALEAVCAPVATFQITGGTGAIRDIWSEPWGDHGGLNVSGPGFTASIGAEGGVGPGLLYHYSPPASTTLNSDAGFSSVMPGPWGSGGFSSPLFDPDLLVGYGWVFFTTPVFDLVPGKTQYRIPFQAVVTFGLYDWSQAPHHLLPVDVVLRGGGIAIPDIVMDPTNPDGYYTIRSVEYQFTAIPEPTTAPLVFATFALLAYMRIRCLSRNERGCRRNQE
jgi:hypothetical protein